MQGREIDPEQPGELRTRSAWSEHDRILYLTLRRGLLLGQAQLKWPGEVSEYSGKLPH
jgi:hypothetical protein